MDKSQRTPGKKEQDAEQIRNEKGRDHDQARPSEENQHVPGQPDHGQ